MKIEVGKKYKTRDGRIVRIICTDMKPSTYPVVALCDEGEYETIMVYTSSGSVSITDIETPSDIVSEVRTVKYLKPLHEVIKNMEWTIYNHFEDKKTGNIVLIPEFQRFGKEIPQNIATNYPKDWIEEREV